MNTNDRFFDTQPEPLKSCFLAMRKLVLSSATPLTETTKYGMPCFTLAGKPICYLWKDKKSQNPYFLWVDGEAIRHELLEKGDRKKMYILPVNPDEDLQVQAIQEVLMKAIELRH